MADDLKSPINAPVRRRVGRPRKAAAESLAAAAPAALAVAAVEPQAIAAPAEVDVAPVPAELAPAEIAPAQLTPAQITPVEAAAEPAPAEIETPVEAVAVEAAAPPAPVDAPETATDAEPVIAADPVTPAARTATASFKDLFKMDTMIPTTPADMTDKFQSAMKDAAEKAKAAFEKSQAAFGDMGEFTKGNVEAVVESTKILAAGLQEMGKSYVSESKTVVETMTAELKELAAVKSPTEFFEKQTALLRKHFDSVVATSSKNSEAVLKLANDAFQPISNRVSLAVEKIKQAA